MPTPITDPELEQLLNFVGYGKLDADVWFLGMEEAGGGEANIRARLKFRTVEDCAEAHQILGITKHHTGKKVIQRTWWGMCYLMLRLAGQPADRESIRNYQADALGRFQGNSLLCELMPIPKPAIHQWGYESLLPQYKLAEAYYQTVKPRRVQYLQTLIQTHRPKTVIGYGKTYWQTYAELFPAMHFVPNGQFLLARDTNTTVIFTDHFTSRTMNGMFDEVVKLCN